VSRPLRLTTLALAAVLWVAALVTAPTIDARIGAAMYAAGSIICHQRSERSFHLEGAQLPVCARCLGLYGGGALGVLAWMSYAGLGRSAAVRARVFADRYAVTTLSLTALPTVLTVITASAGWWDPDNARRAAMALPLGASIAAVVAAVAAGDLR
jgi:uncharacterized membrane protein